MKILIPALLLFLVACDSNVSGQQNTSEQTAPLTLLTPPEPADWNHTINQFEQVLKNAKEEGVNGMYSGHPGYGPRTRSFLRSAIRKLPISGSQQEILIDKTSESHLVTLTEAWEEIKDSPEFDKSNGSPLSASELTKSYLIDGSACQKEFPFC